MKLTVLFGGASFEHEISIVSAITVMGKLKEFDLSFIFCDTDHTFYLIDSQDMKAKTFSSGAYKKKTKLLLTNGGFVEKKMFRSFKHTNTVLNLIHGGDGEDGTIAALLDFFDISYIGPRVNASVFSYDKRFTKLLCDAKKIKCVDYEILDSSTHKEISFEYPIIIKPASLGSSIGVSIVKSEADLDYALDSAYEYDKNVIVEPFIENVKEYNVAGYSHNGKVKFSIVEEPQKDEFLDFEKKYMDFSRSESVLKADIDEKLEKKLKSAFEKVYKNMFEGALIRCDFFVVNGEVILNEINPIPGSMANYLFEDFPKAIKEISESLPSEKKIKVNYEYIHSINSAKGK